MKHTPAPWRFDQEEMKIKGTGDANFHTVIANVSPKMDYSRGMATQCANARLIAAAPELLEALVKLIEWDKKYPPQKIYPHSEAQTITNKLTEIVEQAKSAIQKATQP